MANDIITDKKCLELENIPEIEMTLPEWVFYKAWKEIG
mgnify:CR=1 FL=1